MDLRNFFGATSNLKANSIAFFSKFENNSLIVKPLPTQPTQMSLRRLQDVLKRSRRLTTKQDVITTSGKRRRIYDVLKTSDLLCL